jgi:predicted MFS family arabinose efflux permease
MASLTAPGALAPLRHRRFLLLTVGQVTSNVGDACYAVALPWYVLATHGGAILLGTVLAAYGIPRTALIAVGGYASDRWRPQTVMMATDIARALALAALALTAALGPARAVVLVPLAVVLGAGEGLFIPGSFSILPSLLPDEDLQAGNALASGGMSEVALPALAHGPLHAGASGYGAILAAFGGGALLGTVAAGQARRLRRPVFVASLAFLVQAAFVAVVPYVGSTLAVAAAMACFGMLNGFGNVVTITAFQRWVPPSMMGRLVGLLMLTSFGVFPISVALAALVVRDLGPAPFFLFTAVTLAVATLAGLSQRIWRDFGAVKNTSTDAQTAPATDTEGQPA